MIAQSGLLCNSLSFRGLRPQRLMRPSPGGNAGFGGCAAPEPPGTYGASPARTRVLVAGAYPAPGPGVHFCTHKSEPKKRQPPLGWTPAFV